MIPKNLLPTQLDRYVVAGGWAVCPALSSDMDLFILAGTHADLQDVRQEVLDHLKAEGFDYVEEQETREFIGYDGLVGIGKVAKVWHPTQKGRQIHILVANTTNTLGILESFDLSICMVGIENDGKVVVSENYWTSPIETPIVVKNTPTTPARFNKYAERFGHARRMEESVGETIE